MYELWVFRFGCKGTRNYLCTLSCLRHPIERVDHDEFYSEAVIYPSIGMFILLQYIILRETVETFYETCKLLQELERCR